MAGILNRNSWLVTIGSIGSIQALGPRSLPMCPTEPNFHSPFCQAATSAASAAASAGWAVAPAGANSIEQQRGIAGREARPERGQIFGVEPMLVGHGFQGFAARGQRFAIGERGGEIFFQRQNAAGVGVEHHALQVDLARRRADR